MLIALKLIIMQVFFVALAQEQLIIQNNAEFKFLNNKIEQIKISHQDSLMNSKVSLSRASILKKTKLKVKTIMEDFIVLKKSSIKKNVNKRIFNFKIENKLKKKRKWVRSR